MARSKQRRVVLGVGISIDGYIARKDGSVDFLFMPKDYSMGPFFKRIDTCVMGRKTYEVGLKMGGGFGTTPTYVFSRTLPRGERDGIRFVSGTAGALVRKIRQQPGKDIWLMGGGDLARTFLSEDLVDELYLGVVPVVLGEGIPLFPAGFPQRDFKLIENQTFSKGLIALRYARKR